MHLLNDVFKALTMYMYQLHSYYKLYNMAGIFHVQRLVLVYGHTWDDEPL
jgi:hypothetical protein